MEEGEERKREGNPGNPGNPRKIDGNPSVEIVGNNKPTSNVLTTTNS
jgi:hypothetical protein